MLVGIQQIIQTVKKSSQRPMLFFSARRKARLSTTMTIMRRELIPGRCGLENLTSKIRLKIRKKEHQQTKVYSRERVGTPG